MVKCNRAIKYGCPPTSIFCQHEKEHVYIRGECRGRCFDNEKEHPVKCIEVKGK